MLVAFLVGLAVYFMLVYLNNIDNDRKPPPDNDHDEWTGSE